MKYVWVLILLFSQAAWSEGGLSYHFNSVARSLCADQILFEKCVNETTNKFREILLGKLMEIILQSREDVSPQEDALLQNQTYITSLHSKIFEKKDEYLWCQNHFHNNQYVRLQCISIVDKIENMVKQVAVSLSEAFAKGWGP